jgi:hypothetical protein
LFEINDSKEEDPEEVKRRILEEMSKGQSDKKITHQEIQTRLGHISDAQEHRVPALRQHQTVAQPVEAEFGGQQPS